MKQSHYNCIRISYIVTFTAGNDTYHMMQCYNPGRIGGLTQEIISTDVKYYHMHGELAVWYMYYIPKTMPHSSYLDQISAVAAYAIVM